MRRAVLAALLVLAPVPAVLADPGLLGLLCDGATCNFEATTSNGPANEVSIAVDPADASHIVAVGKDYTLGPAGSCGVTRVWLGWYTSFDGGRTWLNGLAPGYPGGPPGPLTGYGCVSDPVVAFGGDGSVYISGLALAGPGGKSGVIVLQSTDGGRTFPVSGWAAENTNSNDKNWLAVDPVTHRVYATWTDFNQGIMAAAANGGPASASAGALTFEKAQCIGCGGGLPPLLTNTLGLSLNGQGTFIAIGLDSTVYVTWLAGNTVALSMSPTLGLTWTAPVPAFTINQAGWGAGGTFRTPTLPHLAVDRTTPLGRLYFTWQDQSRDLSDVMVATSDTRGLTWNAPVRVNDDPAGKGNFFPSLCVAPGGKVYVGFVDRRDDPAGYLYNFYGATSADGGATWANQRLSTESSDPKWGKHQQGFTFIGDYTGTACAADGTAWSVWSDTRKETSDAFVAHWT